MMLVVRLEMKKQASVQDNKENREKLENTIT
jgi:hypothetical protein